MKLSLLALGLAGLGLLLLGAAGPAYQMGIPLPAAFALLRWAAYIGLAGAIASIVVGFLSYRKGGRLAAAVCLAAFVAGLAAFGVPYRWQRRAQSVPRIHDITTDLENPPTFEAVVPLRAEAPNSLDRSPDLSDLQRQGYPTLQPITLSLPPGQAFDRALGVAEKSGWEIVKADKATGKIEATDTTRWFRFKDDVVVRLTPWGSGTRVDVRSVSRVGLSDVGTNASRIQTFLNELSKS